MKFDRNYEGTVDGDEYEAPFAPYDKELDFNEEPETEYEPETDEDWAGEEHSDEDDEQEEFDLDQ